jgi:hypothetical protein
LKETEKMGKVNSRVRSHKPFSARRPDKASGENAT